MDLNDLNRIEEIEHINWDEDNEVFLDPLKIIKLKQPISSRTEENIITFFNIFFEATKREDIATVHEIGDNLHEINATRTGYGKGKYPSGKGFCVNDLIEVYNNAQELSEITLEDFYDVFALTPNVGNDKISDLVINLIYDDLLDFTFNICVKYNVPFTEKEKVIFVWNAEQCKWFSHKRRIILINGEELVFIPKGCLVKRETISYHEIYNGAVKPYYRENFIKYDLIKVAKSGEKSFNVGKFNKEYPLNRTTVNTFVNEHRDVYDEFKNNILGYEERN